MNEAQAAQKFHRSVLPHLATVLRVALVLARNNADAEDLAQETMLKAFRGIAGFQEGTDAVGWLLTILRHTRIDRARQSARSVDATSLDAVDAEAIDVESAIAEQAPATDYHALREDPDRVLDGFSDQEIIEHLRTLPQEMRFTLLLVDVEGLTHPEAAAILDVPVGTIKSRAHRARGLLRKALLPMARDARLVQN